MMMAIHREELIRQPRRRHGANDPRRGMTSLILWRGTDEEVRRGRYAKSLRSQPRNARLPANRHADRIDANKNVSSSEWQLREADVLPSWPAIRGMPEQREQQEDHQSEPDGRDEPEREQGAVECQQHNDRSPPRARS